MLACIASQPKEESQADTVEDEGVIMNVLRKAGFHAQQRCRMLLQQPKSVEAMLQTGDWWLDSRLCYLADCDLRPWHVRRRFCSRRRG